jgi:hypothetical protein
VEAEEDVGYAVAYGGGCDQMMTIMTASAL